MKCDNCKTTNDEKRNFCVKCGNPLNEVAKQHFPEMVKPKKN